MSSELEKIETRMAYLEQANTELSDVVYRQQQEIDALLAQVQSLASRLDSVKESATVYSAEEERPPHY